VTREQDIIGAFNIVGYEKPQCPRQAVFSTFVCCVISNTD